jgi:hypothetical protein
MVSTTLLSVSLLSASMLLVRQATRNANESGAAVARERALMAAQGSVQLAAAYYREAAEDDANILDVALAGSFNSGQNTVCKEIDRDCIPGNRFDSDVPTTGQRNSHLTQGRSDCAGRPCMRPGALVVLPDTQGVPVPWTRVQMSQLITGGDDRAVVTTWVRNNTSEALGSGSPGSGTSGSWVQDEDFSLVITAMAEVHGAVVTVEQEFSLMDDPNVKLWEMASPDLAYGGGHNNDNAAVETCNDAMVAGTTP